MVHLCRNKLQAILNARCSPATAAISRRHREQPLPLFFVIFQNRFGISYGLISALILCNFITQVATDVLAVRYVDRIGYRRAAVIAHFLAFFGLMMMGILPNILPAPYVGLVIATIINGVGGGLIEVIISPIVESCPGDAKASAMSLLHSFYCWGQVGVVLVTTLLLRVIGEDLWFVIPALWSLLPFTTCSASSRCR